MSAFSYLELRENRPEIFISKPIKMKYKNLYNTEEFNMKKNDVDFLVDKLGCSQFEAQALLQYDKLVEQGVKDLAHLGESAPAEKPVSASKVAPKAPAKKRSAGIQDAELELMLKDITASLSDKSFKNKDLAPFLESWGLTARQTPSRLKRLVDAGLLEDLGGSPKSYKLK